MFLKAVHLTISQDWNKPKGRIPPSRCGVIPANVIVWRSCIRRPIKKERRKIFELVAALLQPSSNHMMWETTIYLYNPGNVDGHGTDSVRVTGWAISPNIDDIAQTLMTPRIRLTNKHHICVVYVIPLPSPKCTEDIRNGSPPRVLLTLVTHFDLRVISCTPGDVPISTWTTASTHSKLQNYRDEKGPRLNLCRYSLLHLECHHLISNLNWWSSSLGLFYPILLKRDQGDWHWRVSLNDTPNAIVCTLSLLKVIKLISCLVYQ